MHGHTTLLLLLLFLLLLYDMYVSCHRHFFPVLLMNQWWSPPLTLQASHCSTFRIMCDVPSIAVFCSEYIECFPGTASKFFKAFCYYSCGCNYYPFIIIIIISVTSVNVRGQCPLVLLLNVQHKAERCEVKRWGCRLWTVGVWSRGQLSIWHTGAFGGQYYDQMLVTMWQWERGGGWV